MDVAHLEEMEVEFNAVETARGRKRMPYKELNSITKRKQVLETVAILEPTTSFGLRAAENIAKKTGKQELATTIKNLRNEKAVPQNNPKSLTPQEALGWIVNNNVSKLAYNSLRTIEKQKHDRVDHQTMTFCASDLSYFALKLFSNQSN